MDNELGDFLRRCRTGGGVEPQGGAPVEPRPRHGDSGLRREDVARRAGISTSYYTQLEQGRRRNPSPHVLTRIADALGLDPADRRRLLAFAHPRRSAPAGGRHAGLLPALGRAMQALDHLPVMVADDSLDVLQPNRRWLGLHLAFTRTDNLAAMVFLDPAASDFFLDWPQIADTTLELLRQSTHEGGPEVASRTRDHVDALRAASHAFDRRWSAVWVQHAMHPTRVRVLHPILGRMEFRHDVFRDARCRQHHLHVWFPTNGRTTALAALVDVYAGETPGAEGRPRP